MNSSGTKGNNPELWEKLLSFLDEKLQLGLLDHLKRVTTYHFEDNSLFLQSGSETDYKYLTKDTVFQHLQVLAGDAVGVEKVQITKPEE